MASTPWTWDEEKKFAHALEKFPDRHPNKWVMIADELQRSLGEVMEHYEVWLHHNLVIESDRVFDVPGYMEDRPSLFFPLNPERNNYCGRVCYYHLDDWSTSEITDQLQISPGEVRERYEQLVHNDIVITDQLQSPPGEVREHYEPMVHNDFEIESGRVDVPVHMDDAAAGCDSAGHKSFGSKQGESKGKRGTPWTEEEHRLFLIGLQIYRKGDWRSIARNKVKTKTPTQVASHAQKYFMRLNSVKERKRSSIHDITTANLAMPGSNIHDITTTNVAMPEFGQLFTTPSPSD